MNRYIQPMVLILVLLLSGVNRSRGQDACSCQRSYFETDYLLSTPGAAGTAIGGYINPAVYGMLPDQETEFYWSDDQARLNSVKNYGLFTGLPNLGFGLVHSELDNGNGRVGVTDYRLGLGVGDHSTSIGLGYGWSRGYPSSHPVDDMLQIGMVERPCRFASYGLAGSFALGSSDRQGAFDLAIRPTGTPLLTLFADAAMGEKTRLENASWGIGAAVQPLPGIQLTGKYFDSERFTLGVSLSLGRMHVSSAPHFNDDNEIGYTTYGIRLGYPTRNVIDQYLINKRRYLSLELKGHVEYRKYKYFDEETHTLSDILFALEQAADDSRIAGVALNLSGADIPRVMSWEIREALKAVQAAGKKVVIFIDNGEMKEYHLASVADRIVMDPQGMLILPGYVAGNTYMRGTLDKLGLGVDEWRFFKYKSAFEVLSRDSMSEAQQEQLQALVDDFYTIVRGDICASRNIPPDKFDALVDQVVAFPSEIALAYGLVDTLGRWNDIDDIIAGLEQGGKSMVGRQKLAGREFPSLPWGEKPAVAIVYGLGECAMDKGINARRLEKLFKSVKEDRQVKAVVFRVDSPGGDGMASDVVAEALRRCAAEKPVIVSQGGVAGSGGYWISMYGDTIVAAPGTVTGSVGVIGGWLWNKGLGSKLGMTSDHVMVGDHADLGFGITLPMLGLTVPDRNLTPEERLQVEGLIRSMYRSFVAKVANGRHMSEADVDSVGQGRVWSGLDGKEKGLVDVIGGLDTAIALARRAAGILPEREIKIKELPQKGLFRLFFLSDQDELFDFAQDREWQYLKLISEHPGQPLPVVPPDLYPE